MRKLFLFSMIIPMALLASCGPDGKIGGDAGMEQEIPTIQHVGTKDAMPMLGDTNVITIDVRTPGEIQAGYIDGADLFIDINGDFRTEIAKLDKNKTYLVYCKSGARSSNAAKIMEAEDFTSIYNLTGGISNWTGLIKQ